jgi:hypothetical protein
VVRLEKSRSGIWEAELRSVDQGNTASPIESVQYDASRLRFEVNTIAGTYEGVVNANRSEISGQWKQATFPAMPLIFRRK